MDKFCAQLEEIIIHYGRVIISTFFYYYVYLFCYIQFSMEKMGSEKAENMEKEYNSDLVNNGNPNIFV